VSRPGRALAPRKGPPPPGAYWTEGWVGPRASLNKEAIEKILCPCRGSNPDRPVVQPVVRHYTAWANPAHAERRHGCRNSKFPLILSICVKVSCLELRSLSATLSYSYSVKTTRSPCSAAFHVMEYNGGVCDITAATSTNSKSNLLWSSKIRIVYVQACKEVSLQLLNRRACVEGFYWTAPVAITQT
jgi:hypothetical protein